MDGLDRKLTCLFRASLPADEALSQILSPRVLASEVAGKELHIIRIICVFSRDA